MKVIPEDSDIECGRFDDCSRIVKGDQSHARMHSWSTASTVATVGVDEKAGQAEEAVEVSFRSVDGKPTRSLRQEPAFTSHKSPTMIFAACTLSVVVFAIIATVVVLTSRVEYSQPSSRDHGGQAELNVKMLDDDNFEYFWNPVLDLEVVYDPTNSSRFILRDDKDVCHPRIVKAPHHEGNSLEWGAVQPTAKSTAVLGIMPHIQTCEDHYLELSYNTRIELGPDKDWTLSFSGARLNELSKEKTDTIFLGKSLSKTKSFFALCYKADNSIGLGSCQGEESTTIVQLPQSVMKFHVLTLTYCQKDGKLQIYQNTELVADMEYQNTIETTSLSYIGPPHYDKKDDSPLSNASSNIALRHVAYLDKHIEAGNVVDIADLALHMST